MMQEFPDMLQCDVEGGRRMNDIASNDQIIGSCFESLIGRVSADVKGLELKPRVIREPLSSGGKESGRNIGKSTLDFSV
jgi:hypothetical protein